MISPGTTALLENPHIVSELIADPSLLGRTVEELLRYLTISDVLLRVAKGAESMRIIVDRDVCTGSGQCVLTEPSVFRQSDEDGMVELIADRPYEDAAEAVQAAVALCPCWALSIEN